MHIISGGDKGGAKTHMFALLDELCKIADVTVVCLMKGVFYEEIIERDVRTVLLEQHTRFDFSVKNKLEKMIKQEGFDIVNAHGARANFIAMFLNQKKLGIPVVTTVHSDPLLDFDTITKKLFFTNINIMALKRLDYKIAVTDSLHDMLIERGYAPNNIRTVRNGMDFESEEQHGTKEDFAKRFNIPYDPSKVYFGIAARLVHVKGVDQFIKVAAKVLEKTDDARFVIIGEGEDEEALKGLARELGVEDKIYFLGFVKEVYDFLNFIDVNMLTSLSEGFPYSILEGAKAKKATVTTSVGGIPLLIRDSENGYMFECGDFDTARDKLLDLIEHREKIVEFGERIYVDAKRDFSNKTLANNYYKSYEEFIRKFNRKKKYDILISGYYGFNNFGDDMVARTLITELKKAHPQLEMCVLSRNPKSTAVSLGVDSMDRYSFLKLFKIIKNSEIYAYGGGTLLTDITSRKSLQYYTTTLMYAKRHGLKTAIIANGLGPFIHKSSEKAVCKILDKVDTLAFRDYNSFEYAKRLSSKVDPYLTADLALLFEPSNEAVKSIEAFLASNSLAKGNYFVVSLREWKNIPRDYTSTIASACDYIAEKYGLTPVFVPLQPSKDTRISEEVCMKTKTYSVVAYSVNDVDNVCALIQNSGFTLAMRLHPLIYSYSASIPFLGLSYDEKVSSFIKEVERNDYLDVADITLPPLKEMIDKAFSEKRSYDSLETMMERSKKNIELISELL